jgi:hypothetical protein
MASEPGDLRLIRRNRAGRVDPEVRSIHFEGADPPRGPDRQGPAGPDPVERLQELSTSHRVDHLALEIRDHKRTPAPGQGARNGQLPAISGECESQHRRRGKEQCPEQFHLAHQTIARYCVASGQTMVRLRRLVGASGERYAGSVNTGTGS